MARAIVLNTPFPRAFRRTSPSRAQRRPVGCRSRLHPAGFGRGRLPARRRVGGPDRVHRRRPLRSGPDRGRGQAPPGVIGLVWIYAPEVYASIGARVETIGPQHVTLLSTAGRFGPGPIPLPPVPVAPLMDLTYAWHQQTLNHCEQKKNSLPFSHFSLHPLNPKP